jgi:hypothetical protein
MGFRVVGEEAGMGMVARVVVREMMVRRRR